MYTRYPHELPTNAPDLRAWLIQQLGDSTEQGTPAVLADALLEDVLTWHKPYGPQQKADKLELERLVQSLERVQAGEPLAYATGVAHFLGMRLQVDKRVLIPRPETEELVVAVCGAWQGQSPHVLDVGTGSACVALALAQRMPAAKVTGMDVSQDALNVAKANADQLGLDVHWQLGDFLDPSFWNALSNVDVLVSNPPYIDPTEAPTLAAHVTDHEPHAALFAPPNDALAFYRAAVEFVKTRIAESAAPRAFLETSSLTAKAALALAQDAGLKGRLLKDLSGRDRVLVLV